MDDLIATGIFSRRRLLQTGFLAGSGLALAALVGCGGDDDDDDGEESTTATTSTGTTSSGTTSQSSTSTSDTTTAAPDESGERFTTVLPWPDKTPVKGGTLTLSEAQQIGSFDPTKSGAIGNLRHTGTAMETLLGWRLTHDQAELNQRDIRRDIEGNLAESWELQPDGLNYTFSIRPGVKWHNKPPVNGRAFVAGDVRFAYERYAETGVWQQLFAFVDAWDTPDDQSLTLRMQRPSPDIVVPFGEQNLAIYPREVVDDGSIDTVLVGTGPLILDEYSQSEFARYTPNPDHWGPGTYLDGYEVLVTPDAATRLSQFRAGQAAVGRAGSLAQLEDVRGTNPGLQVGQSAWTKSIFGMVFNQKEEKWQDVRVRQALHLGIDRDEINLLLYDGISDTLPIIPWNHVFDEKPSADRGELGPWWRYDPDEAMKLLQAAGAEGLEIDFLIYRGYVRDQNDVWVDQLRRIGVNLNPRDADYVEFNSQLAGVSYPDAIGAWDIHGTQADNYFRDQLLSTSPGNWHNINDPQLDEWAEQQSVELDPDARREILRQIWDKVLVDVHRVEHTNFLSFVLYQEWLHGMQWRVGSDGLGGSVFGYNNSRFISSVWIEK